MDLKAREKLPKSSTANRGKKRKLADADSPPGSPVPGALSKVSLEDKIEKQKARLKAKWGLHTFNTHLTRFETLAAFQYLNALATKTSFSIATRLLNRQMLDRLEAITPARGRVPSKEGRWVNADLEKASRIPQLDKNYAPEFLAKVTEVQLAKYELIQIDEVLYGKYLTPSVPRSTAANTDRHSMQAMLNRINSKASPTKDKSRLDRPKPPTRSGLDLLATSNTAKAKRITMTKEVKEEIKTETKAGSLIDLSNDKDNDYLDEETRALATKNAADEDELKRLEAKLKAYQVEKKKADKIKAKREELLKAMADHKGT